MYKLASLENDASEQRFDITIATVAIVAMQQSHSCMVSCDPKKFKCVFIIGFFL